MIWSIVYVIVALLVIFVGYKAYSTNEATDKDKFNHVIVALLIMALFWPVLVVVMIIIYIIYKRKVWRNVKDFKNKLDKW